MKALDLLLGLGCLMVAVVGLLALPPDITDARSAAGLSGSSQVASADPVVVLVASKGRGGSSIEGVRATVTTPRGPIELRLVGVFEDTDLAEGRHPAPIGSRYSAPLPVRYDAGTGDAMAEVDYAAVRAGHRVRTDLLLLAAALGWVAGFAYLRFGRPRRSAR